MKKKRTLKSDEGMPQSSSQRWSGSTEDDEHRPMKVSEDDDGGRPTRTVRQRLRHQQNDAPGKRVVEAADDEDDQDDDDDDDEEDDADEGGIVSFPTMESVKEGTRHIVKRLWSVQKHDFLPDWLQDNEYIQSGHRPPLPSFSACFKSIFSLHSETGNIWTHMFGCVAFIGLMIWYMARLAGKVQWLERLVFSIFFLSAIICLGTSFVFHTVACHSISVHNLFRKLDYVGISILIMGSFVPWLFYSFYCRYQPQIIYLVMICTLGIAAIIMSMMDMFSAQKYRPLRAGVFCAMGLSGVVPGIHFIITDGLRTSFNEASMHWLLLMAFLYLFGAALYATRTPERFFPGKCDIWFQSHQLFHICVVVAAFVHYHGISEMAVKRLHGGACPE